MKNFYQTVVIAFLILLISILHLRAGHADFQVHLLHRELFFIPIILASLWSGLWVGLAVVALVCFIYTPFVLHHGLLLGDADFSQIFTQIVMYWVIGGLIGWLSDRWHREQDELLQVERLTSLAKAASTLGFEIKDVVGNLQNIYSSSGGLIDLKQEKYFQTELDRLRHLVMILDEYKPITNQVALCDDLNKLLLECSQSYKKQAKKKGVKLVVNLDPVGCPTMIDAKCLVNTVCSLIDNAFDVSKRGDSISLTSERKGPECILSVSDNGPGVLDENLPKLFSPFFTTKAKGSGLGLSSGQKVLREQGGDLLFKPSPSGGSTFSIIVPQENSEYNLDNYITDHDFNK
jgi:signal transduction histidine kinase